MKVRTLAAYAAWLVMGCNPNSVGRPCVDPVNAAVDGIQISSPALECPSRLCLIEPLDGGAGRATCTASCQDDSDCAAASNDNCKSAEGTPLGFACAVVFQTGKLACRKLCICRGDLRSGVNVDVDGGVMVPASCLHVAP